MGLHIGSIAPDFTQDSTAGSIHFHEWLGSSWGVLFSHPRDFTPVCTTELGRASALKAEFDKRNVKLLAVSVDPVSDHEKWVGDIEETRNSVQALEDYLQQFDLGALSDRLAALEAGGGGGNGGGDLSAISAGLREVREQLRPLADADQRLAHLEHALSQPDGASGDELRQLRQRVEALAPDGVTVRVTLKTAPMEQWKVAREMRERIKDRFDAEGIEIPFPQRVVWHRNADEAPAGAGEAGGSAGE